MEPRILEKPIGPENTNGEIERKLAVVKYVRNLDPILNAADEYAAGAFIPGVMGAFTRREVERAVSRWYRNQSDFAEVKLAWKNARFARTCYQIAGWILVIAGAFALGSILGCESTSEPLSMEPGLVASWTADGVDWKIVRGPSVFVDPNGSQRIVAAGAVEAFGTKSKP